MVSRWVSRRALYLTVLSLGAAACSRTTENGPSNPQPNAPSATNSPASAATKNTADLEGHIDVANAMRIAGWAWDRKEPDTPIRVDIYDGKEVIATILANIPRPTLVKAKKGNGVHGFEYQFPNALRDGREHTFAVCFAGSGKALKGSPKTLVLEVRPSSQPKSSDTEKNKDKEKNKDADKNKDKEKKPDTDKDKEKNKDKNKDTDKKSSSSKSNGT